jgi:cellulose synthase (UDP-forming)
MKNGKRISNNSPLIKVFSCAAAIYFVYYLVWRAVNTINPDFQFFSWLLWGAEAFGVVSYILFAWITADISPITPHKKPDAGKQVDVLVPTYNESLEILEATLIGCREIRYPHTTYILDDGNRPQVKKLAERLGCKYIARPTHEHAKAGNINYALTKTKGEFLVVLDADMVPQPEFLDRTLGYFNDPKLALIQLPQEFYNLDSIQHAKNQTSWHEQSLFFRVIQPGKNHSNSAFWCGSPSVVRRSAIESIGGVATETITEDIHTTVRLHSRGWKTLFINEALAFGIAPQTIRAFLLQRLRWAQGTMQLYRSKESPLWIHGLSWKQRFSYLASFMAYLESFQKFILITLPVIILTFNIFPMRVNFLEFFLRWGIYFGLNLLANQIGGRGVFHYFKTEKYNLLKTIIFMQSTLTLFSKKPLSFKVTPKEVDDNVYRQERKSMRWFMGFLGFLVGAMAYSLFHIYTSDVTPATADMLAVAFFWASYNSLIIIMALREVFSKRHERKQYRFPVQAKGRLYGQPLDVPYLKANLYDLSISGAGITVKGKLPVDVLDLRLEIIPGDFSSFTVPVKKVFLRGDSGAQFSRVGTLFAEDLGPQREMLFEYLFIHLPGKANHAFYRPIRWDPFQILEKQYEQ